MADYNWGYREAARVMGHARGGKVGVKRLPKPVAITPKITKVTATTVKPKLPLGIAAAAPEVEMKADGGKIKVRAHVRRYAKGGAVKAKGMKDGGNWIADATKNKGGLHKSLGIAQGKKIPAKTLAKAATKSGKVGKQARLAQTLKGLHKADGGKVKEGSKADMAADAKSAKKAGMSLKKWEGSAADKKQDAGMKRGGKVTKGTC